MTTNELAEIRGEIQGLKTLVAQCLGFISNLTDDPVLHLNEIQTACLEGIAASTDDRLKEAFQRRRMDAAARIVLQLVEAAKSISEKAGRLH
jgi:hypothetical protein